MWISILEASGLIFLLPPYFKNFSKRVIKTPKLYFLDTGILCYLLVIHKERELSGHRLIGSIFETCMISECYKRLSHIGEVPHLYFWRDKTGREIDLIIEDSLEPFPIEIKLSQTYNSSFLDTLHYWTGLREVKSQRGEIIYTGNDIIGADTRFPTIPWDFL